MKNKINGKIIATPKEIKIQGSQAAILTLWTIITKAINQKIDEKILRKSFELAFMSDKKLKQEEKRLRKEVKKKLEEVINE